MSSPRPVRSDVTRSHFNRRHVEFVSFQCVVAAAVVGVYFSSWWAFLGAAFALGALIQSPFAIVLVVALSVLWGAAGAVVGKLVGGLDGAGVMMILGFGIGFMVNHSGLQYLKDVTDSDQMEL